MSGAQQLLAGGSSSSILYADDVFSTWLRSGTGASAAITAGFQPDLVWTKARSAATGHYLTDSARGVTKSLNTNNTNAQATDANGITAFGTTGYTVGSDTNYNNSTGPVTYVDWVWKKAAKFFDVVTYTGNGVSGRSITHNLGQTPGMVIIKCTSNAVDWCVYHRSVGATKFLYLNSTVAAITSSTRFADTEPTSSTFTVGNDSDTNGNTLTYVAYLFAHDTATDGIIQCGSFTTDGSGNATVTLGWEPQYVITKVSSTTGSWKTADSMRGMLVDGSNQQLYPNLANAEASSTAVAPNATGFTTVNAGNSSTFVYLAIRRPNKPPTSGTQVYQAVTNSAEPVSTTRNTFSGLIPDAVIDFARKDSGSLGATVQSRLSPKQITASGTAAEGSQYFNFDSSSYAYIVAGGYANNTTPNTPYVTWAFRRAPGVFDVVCDTGTGSAHTINHNLAAVPELIIRKTRVGTTQAWRVYVAALGTNKTLYLDDTAAAATSTTVWNDTAPTSSVFTVGTATTTNENTSTYVSYLFATKAGISKVGSYTGNGNDATAGGQTINCGFAAGARFILIKRTDSTGDWYVYDTARGINAGNDPHLSLNTTAAEVNTTDDIDSDNSGFIVNQNATTNLNVTSATYIYLAFA